MLSTRSLLCALTLAAFAHGLPGTLGDRARSDFNVTCNRIAAAISNSSEVFFPCVYYVFNHVLTSELIP